MTTSITHTLTPEAGRYDFDGASAPHSPAYSTVYHTFTLGIFQWGIKWAYAGRPAESLKTHHLKRGKVFRRVKGYRGNEAAAYEEANRIIAELNSAQPAS